MGKGRNAKNAPKSRTYDKKNDKNSNIDVSSLGIDKYKIFVLILGNFFPSIPFWMKNNVGV